MSREAPRRRESPSFSRLSPSSPERGLGAVNGGRRGSLDGKLGMVENHGFEDKERGLEVALGMVLLWV